MDKDLVLDWIKSNNLKTITEYLKKQNVVDTCGVSPQVG